MPLPLNSIPPKIQFPSNIQKLRFQTTTVSWRLRRTIVFCGALAPLGLWVGLVLTLATGGRASDRPAGQISGEQTGTISGRVSNRATNAYLEGAAVVLSPSGMSTLTSRDGRYAFPRVPVGTHALSISYAGLDRQTVSTTVDAGRIAVQDVSLTSLVYPARRSRGTR